MKTRNRSRFSNDRVQENHFWQIIRIPKARLLVRPTAKIIHIAVCNVFLKTMHRIVQQSHDHQSTPPEDVQGYHESVITTVRDKLDIRLDALV